MINFDGANVSECRKYDLFAFCEIIFGIVPSGIGLSAPLPPRCLRAALQGQGARLHHWLRFEQQQE